MMRANLNGSTWKPWWRRAAARTRPPRPDEWCVGIALDAGHGQIYWTQKGGNNANLGVVRRAPVEMRKGEDAAHRTDIQTLYTGLPEPIDLDIDTAHGMLYWTDRGDPPRGNTVNRAPADGRGPVDILVSGLKEGIGMALDLKHGRMFYTDLAGSVYSARLDGSDKQTLLFAEVNLDGIAYVELTLKEK